MVMFVDAPALQGALESVPAPRRTAFGASCAQRLSRCFLNRGIRADRPADARTVETALDEVWDWSLRGGTASIADIRAKLAAIPEWSLDEEPDSAEAFRLDLLVILDATLRSCQDGLTRHLLLTARRAFDAAWFLESRLHVPEGPIDPLDDLSGPSWKDPPEQAQLLHFHSRELHHQEADLALISSTESSELAAALHSMRESSQAYADDFWQALDRHY